MIKYKVNIGLYDLNDKKHDLREIEDFYNEKELSKALSNTAGLIRECLVAKTIAVDYIHFYQVIDGDEYFLFRFSAEEFCNIYILAKNKEEK